MDTLNEYTQAYDFQDSSPQRFNVVVWQNDTENLQRGQAPPLRLRVVKVRATAYTQL